MSRPDQHQNDSACDLEGGQRDAQDAEDGLPGKWQKAASTISVVSAPLRAMRRRRASSDTFGDGPETWAARRTDQPEKKWN